MKKGKNMNRLLTTQEFDTVLQKLSGDYEFWGPVRKAGRGRFSDSDLIIYEQIGSAGQIVWDRKTYRSAKEIVFPVNETLLRFDEGKIGAPSQSVEQGMIVFCRSCDIHAIKRLDRIFLQNGPQADPYYRRLRERLHFVLMECAEPFESCFCVSMKTNSSDDFAAAVRKVAAGVLIGSDFQPFAELLEQTGTPHEFELQFPRENGTDIFPPESTEMPQNLYDHEMWEEYSTRCIACGRCNTSCPTCSCFSVHDIQYDRLSGQAGERRRVWAGCHIDGFTDMAGGMEFRKSLGARMRFKTFHKIYDFRRRFGENMCVGCGRCDDVCPEYISFANCINKLNKVIRSQESAHE